MYSKRRKTSELWTFFKSTGEDAACCNLCRSTLSFKGSVSNLKKHLQRKHPTVTLQNNLPSTVNTEEQPQPIIENLPSTSASESVAAIIETQPIMIPPQRPTYPLKKQSAISTYIPKKMTINEKNKIDLAIMKFIAWDFQPFSVVEDRGFRNLMNICVPSYKIPSRKYFANSVLPALYEEKKNEMKRTLKEQALSVCLTTDSWSSPTNDSYNAITAHYINQDFEMKATTLDCSSFNVSHTSQNLADEILRVVNEWELDNKISVVTTDNAANITNAISILKWKHYGCYAHKLNLVLQNSFSPVEALIQKIKNIVAFFKRSNAATQKLVKYQQQIGVNQPKRLLQDVITRWNSTYIMLERFVLLEEAVKHALALSNTELVSLTPEEWDICKQLCQVLEPCEEVTREISAEKYLTASKIIPITRGLKSSLRKISATATHSAVKEVLKYVLEGIANRFPNLEASRTICLCTFLDPRYKHHLYEHESTAETTKKEAIELVTQLLNQKKVLKEIDALEENEIKLEENSKTSIWDDLDITMSKVKPLGTSRSQAIIEVGRYMEDQPLSRKKNPLEWWKENQHLYPNLSCLVKTKCNMVATSVPCERVFSKAGCLISERSRLTTKKVKELMFLNVNI